MEFEALSQGHQLKTSHKYYARQLFWPYYLGGLIAAPIALICAMYLFNSFVAVGDSVIVMLIYGLSLASVLYIVYIITSYVVSLKTLKMLSELSLGPISITINDSGVTAQGRNHSFHYTWNIIKKISHQNGFYLLIIDINYIIPLPENLITDPEGFEQYIQNRIDAAVEDNR